MAFLDHVLQQPSYGWSDEQGQLTRPQISVILKEFAGRPKLFKDRKNWLPFFSWHQALCLVPFVALFVFKFFSLWMFIAAFPYGMIIMGSHGAIWHHRFCTHGAYRFKNRFWRFTQNLTINIIPAEIYVISHHVHHAKSDQPGDPYNAKGRFWYAAFYLKGGHALACTLFAAAGIWAVGVRTFNYDGHGHGEDKQRNGIDYNRNNRSINQMWPGIVAGKWHNNHHLYPKSARSGFKSHQLDLAWIYIKFLYRVSAVSSYRDDKTVFAKKYLR